MGRQLLGQNFCVGEHVKFECNIPGVQNFVWFVPRFIEGNSGLIGGVVPTAMVNNFNLAATSGRSMLEVVAFAGQVLPSLVPSQL